MDFIYLTRKCEDTLLEIAQRKAIEKGVDLKERLFEQTQQHQEALKKR